MFVSLSTMLAARAARPRKCLTKPVSMSYRKYWLTLVSFLRYHRIFALVSNPFIILFL